MTIEVRDARPGEYDAIGAVVAAAFAADGQLDGVGTAFYDAVLRDVAGRAEHAQVVAALDDGVVVGGVTYVPDGGPMADLARDGEAEIRMLGVAPDAQGRGAGTALVRECLERAAGRSVVLSTNAVARTSHRLYERLGFVREPARDWVPVPDVTLLCYVRDGYVR